ncbi:hypothetical protein [Actinoplanes utahensis]|uniref:DUF1330 domain-containing protein n=1 Tax=Actinoplanes utahensis TaxID=1869 RepID=A0A0A6X2V5_ACTUT|nr:hypothetical protein [Actinoplanes utahensis]KHD74442.1 hypothetical protein MB27_28905 [Actinoplanes utahensis]GIF34362.1 hypothetical protein Aut01nite_73480 [Actinoplanes utahensis]
MTEKDLLLVAVVEMADGEAEAGQRYEDAVLALLERHGGTLERRMRDTGPAGSEVHVIRFRDRAGLAAYLQDPDRVALRAAVGEAVPTARVLEVRDLPAR